MPPARDDIPPPLASTPLDFVASEARRDAGRCPVPPPSTPIGVRSMTDSFFIVLIFSTDADNDDDDDDDRVQVEM